MRYINFLTFIIVIMIFTLGCRSVKSSLFESKNHNKIEFLDVVKTNNRLLGKNRLQTYTQINPRRPIKLKYETSYKEVSEKGNDSISTVNNYHLDIEVASYPEIVATINSSMNDEQFDFFQTEKNLKIITSIKFEVTKEIFEKFNDVTSVSLDNSNRFKPSFNLFTKDGVEKINIFDIKIIDFDYSCLCWQLKNNKPKVATINKRCPRGTTQKINNLNFKSFSDYEKY